MRIANIIGESVVDGTGVRVVIFLQGCLHHCPGCHNKETWPLDGGEEVTPQELFERVQKLITPVHSGITISGGEPLLQPEELNEFLRLFKQEYKNLNVWLYTGFIFEAISDLIPQQVNIVVDGRFFKSLRDIGLKFRGSSNQQIIDARTGEVID